jgi:hypothetical protein
MELYIQIRDGQPYEHPIMGDNFREAFPHIDINNLPPEFARFVRVPEPSIGLFEVNDGVEYVMLDGVVRDVWKVRPMTPEERAPVETLAIQRIMTKFAQLKEEAAIKSVNATPEVLRQAWEDYKTFLDSWVLNNIETDRLPMPPFLMPNGKVQVLTLSGSAPNVYG